MRPRNQNLRTYGFAIVEILLISALAGFGSVLFGTFAVDHFKTQRLKRNTRAEWEASHKENFALIYKNRTSPKSEKEVLNHIGVVLEKYKPDEGMFLVSLESVFETEYQTLKRKIYLLESYIDMEGARQMRDHVLERLSQLRSGESQRVGLSKAEVRDLLNTVHQSYIGNGIGVETDAERQLNAIELELCYLDGKCNDYNPEDLQDVIVTSRTSLESLIQESLQMGFIVREIRLAGPVLENAIKQKISLGDILIKGTPKNPKTIFGGSRRHDVSDLVEYVNRLEQHPHCKDLMQRALATQ